MAKPIPYPNPNLYKPYFKPKTDDQCYFRERERKRERKRSAIRSRERELELKMFGRTRSE